MKLLGKANIHPTAVVDDEVTLEDGVTIGAFSYITSKVYIAANVSIGAHCTIGTAAEHTLKPSLGSVYIGAQTTITDGVVIHRGTDEIVTTIGANCFIMNKAYIAHDCVLNDNVVISAHVALAGKVVLQQGANLGMGVLVHQFSTIGAYAMIGMGTNVTKDIPPFAKAYGNPIKLKALNNYALQKLGLLHNQEELTLHDNGFIVANNETIIAANNNFKKASKRPIAEKG
jgi:UDP-N-acetylglucosamine acyltransferase